MASGTAADISLASNALILIGHETIASFTEETAGAEVASNLYKLSYNSILTQHRWRFATKQAPLSRLSEKPLGVFEYQHQLPQDMLYLIRPINIRNYEIYGDKLYCNELHVDVEYLWDIPADRLPPYYGKMFEFYLASQFAIPITGDIAKASHFSQQYEKALIKAKFADSTQRPNAAFLDHPYVDVRF